MDKKIDVGDRIRLLDMQDEVRAPLGATGTVKRIIDDPFEPGNKIVEVDWDQSFSLSLLTNYDMWKVLPKKINEGQDANFEYLVKNRDLKKSFDLDYFKNYLNVLKESGIVNMFGSSPFLYMDEEHLERYYGENREDNENFQKLLSIQDETRQKFIQGLVKFAEKTDMDLLSDDARLNNLAKRLSKKILEYYVLFY